MTTAGFLDVFPGSAGTWLFNFDEHAGKVNELLSFNTSCNPQTQFVSHSEFVVLGCRGADDKLDMFGFNLKGDEMWEQDFSDNHINPTFAYAPAAGRFALERTLVSVQTDLTAPAPADVEEVRVYQTYNGKLLFRLDCTPVQRAGQNYDLSPDGLQAAVVREEGTHYQATKEHGAYTQVETGVEIYALPPLSKDDRAAVEKAQTLAPADTGARIDLSLARISAANSAQAAPHGPQRTGTAGGPSSIAPVEDEAQQTATGMPDVDTPAQTGAANAPATVVMGDPPPDAPRKPPTLYNPGEKQQKPQ
jgi:hypothetical protein